MHWLKLLQNFTFPFQNLDHPKQKSFELVLVAQRYMKKAFISIIRKPFVSIESHWFWCNYLCFRNLWQLEWFHSQKCLIFSWLFQDCRQIDRFLMPDPWFFGQEFSEDNRNRWGFWQQRILTAAFGILPSFRNFWENRRTNTFCSRKLKYISSVVWQQVKMAKVYHPWWSFQSFEHPHHLSAFLLSKDRQSRDVEICSPWRGSQPECLCHCRVLPTRKRYEVWIGFHSPAVISRVDKIEYLRTATAHFWMSKIMKI